jgi:hypothetical protein
MKKQFTRCTPHLPVKSLRDTLDYYRNLGFTDDWVYGEKDGGTSRDELRLLFVEDPDHAELINGKRRLGLVWFVDNIDEVYKEFLDKGIPLTEGLREHPYGLREFSFFDINNYYIRVAERVSPS